MGSFFCGHSWCGTTGRCIINHSGIGCGAWRFYEVFCKFYSVCRAVLCNSLRNTKDISFRIFRFLARIKRRVRSPIMDGKKIFIVRIIINLNFPPFPRNFFQGFKQHDDTISLNCSNIQITIESWSFSHKVFSTQ